MLKKFILFFSLLSIYNFSIANPDYESDSSDNSNSSESLSDDESFARKYQKISNNNNNKNKKNTDKSDNNTLLSAPFMFHSRVKYWSDDLGRALTENGFDNFKDEAKKRAQFLHCPPFAADAGVLGLAKKIKLSGKGESYHVPAVLVFYDKFLFPNGTESTVPCRYEISFNKEQCVYHRFLKTTNLDASFLAGCRNWLQKLKLVQHSSAPIEKNNKIQQYVDGSSIVCDDKDSLQISAQDTKFGRFSLIFCK